MPEEKFRVALNPDLTPQERKRGVVDLVVMATIVNGLVEGWRNCNARCRRAHRCMSPTIACFDLSREGIREFIEDLAAWSRFEGPRDPEELEEPAKDLLD